MREIVTLQFGQRANHLATHFWNTQESYFTYTPNTEPSIVDHDVHFRPGIGSDGSETYTPRTVIYDLKGGFGSLKKINALYDDVSGNDSDIASGLWTGRAVPHRNAAIPQSTYQQNLDAGLPTQQLTSADVRYWSDFNRVFFHPRSIVQLNEYSLNSQLTPFESWNAGDELFRDVDREADLLDRDVRLFAEEADQMQGFQVFAETDGAWGGFSTKYLDALRDEYGKKSIWVWGIEDGKRTDRAKGIARAANAARSLIGMGELVNAYVRLSNIPSRAPKYIGLENNDWATSALMAAAIESATLPTRLRTDAGVKQSTLSMYESLLNTNGGQNLCTLGTTFTHPDEAQLSTSPAQANGQSPSYEHDSEDEPPEQDTDFTPSLASLLSQPLKLSSQHTFARISSVRQPPSQSILPTPTLDPNVLLQHRYNNTPILTTYTTPLPFPTLDTFPSTLISSSYLNPPSRSNYSLTSTLATSTQVKNEIYVLRDLVTRQSRAVALDEREDVYNGLSEVGERYGHGWESDGDSDDD